MLDNKSLVFLGMMMHDQTVKTHPSGKGSATTDFLIKAGRGIAIGGVLTASASMAVSFAANYGKSPR